MERLSDKEIMQEYVLSKIIRYNHRRRLQDESVAEHTFYVILLSLILADKYKVTDKVIDFKFTIK